MKDRFTEAEMELKEKSPFICISCGHPNDIDNPHETSAVKLGKGVHDRFTEAVLEEAEKSAFICESCGKEQKLPEKIKH